MPVFHRKPAFKYGLAGFACSLMAFGLFRLATPVVDEFKSSFAMREFKEFGIYGTYKKHFFSFVDRVDEFAGLDRENRQLNRKVAELEKERILGDAVQAGRDLASLNEILEENLRNDAGSELATALHSIKYEVPLHLASHQIHALGVGYFRREDYEKAAVMFHHILNLKDDAQYRSADNHLMSGISWYHLKNYHLALRDFREGVRLSTKGQNAHKKSIFWQALAYRALKKDELAKRTMLEFLEWYPGSVEAAWLNGKRKPASGASEPVGEGHGHHD